jgi:hypothetical protein
VLERIKQEVNKFNEMTAAISGSDNFNKVKIKESQTDIKSYIKYILRNGRIDEKREILSSLNSKLLLKNKIIKIC